MKYNKKSLQVIEFSGRKSDWKIWSQKFLAQGNKRGYNDIFEGKRAIPTKRQYEDAKTKIDPAPVDEKNITTFEQAISAFEDLILSINGESKAGKVAFELVNGCSTTNNLDEDVKLA